MVVKENILKAAKAMNAMCKENDDKRDAGLPHDIPEVERFDDIAYGPKEKWNLLDVYLPRKRGKKVPTIISIHGGGWVYGTKETYQFFGLSLAKNGFAFVNFNYQLAPEVEFPSELDDINRAMHWVATHGSEYHLDLDNIFIIGDSAGGQMAMQYLTILTNDGFRQKFGYEKPNFIVRAAAINCGAAFLNLPGMIEGAPQAYFTDNVLETKKDMLETEEYITQDIPPLLLTTANQDFIRDCTVRLDGFLTAKHINHVFRSYGTAEEPKAHVFNYNVKDPVATKCNLEILDFFKQYLA
ncbi:alpha/beta hydrolase [Streptococcus equinus]|uniref:alpha/beta hydrolase n=1 Tax=Streptococcus equinus TaxID=1335 RepID=UPI000DFA2594|nr:alpha/beta hydrolase [Streptococcus equinus]SUO79603.1 alpha/beta fold family hydrolase [Streptococcus equinus]